MTTRSGNGLPSRGPLHRLGDAPGLPSKPGGPAPFQPRELTEAEEFPGPEAQSTIRTASLESPVVAPAVGAPPPLVEEGAEAPLPTLVIPRTFEELLFHAILVTPSRELPVVVEQVIAPGASGSITVGIPLAVGGPGSARAV